MWPSVLRQHPQRYLRQRLFLILLQLWLLLLLQSKPMLRWLRVRKGPVVIVAPAVRVAGEVVVVAVEPWMLPQLRLRTRVRVRTLLRLRLGAMVMLEAAVAVLVAAPPALEVSAVVVVAP